MTATADELRALAARVEAAEGADRQLDAEIVWHITPGITGIERGPLDDEGTDYLFEWWPRRPWTASWLEVPAFTASLDAAASLVPAGYAWACYGGDRPEDHATAYCVPNGERLPWPKWVDDICAAAPAIALTAAALRAMAEECSNACD